MSEQLVIPNFPRPSPAAGIVAPVATPKAQFPAGWDEVQAVQLDSDIPAAPVKPELYARWVRFTGDLSNFRRFLQWGFVKCEKHHMQPGKKFDYFDDKDQAYRNGDHILMVAPMKQALGWMKGNYNAANNRVRSHFQNFQNKTQRTSSGAVVAENYIPEVKWEGPKAHFPEDKE